MYFPRGFIKRGNLPFIRNNPDIPKSGDFFIVDSHVSRLWKKDYHSWVTRPDSNRDMECRQVIKIDGKKCVVCTYMKGSGKATYIDENIQGSKLEVRVTPTTFKKRAYYLVDDPRYVLLHYFDEANLVESQRRKNMFGILLGELNTIDNPLKKSTQ